jgi:CheY-like chemotaxis protein
LARTVLLADDSVTAQNMGRRILTDAGYDVITVNNGSAALKKIHENHPDLIVLDVYMPGYGGLEVCQRLKESGETMRIPVLLTVGKMEPFKADEAKRVRADGHIVKPFEASELLAAMAKLEDRIVPQADSSRSRKSKKPSFWHEDEIPVAGRDWTNAEYLAQVKQRNAAESAQTPAEGPAEQAAPESPKVEDSRRLPDATEELPVVADSLPSDSSVSEPTQQNAASSEAPSTKVVETATIPALTGDRKASESPAKIVAEGADPVVARNEASGALTESPIGAAANGPEPQRRDGGDVNARPQGTVDATGSASPNPRWIAENVALTPEEAGLRLDEEMRAAEASERMPATVATLSEIAANTSDPTQGATFAAAAGVGGVAGAGVLNSAAEHSEAPAGAETAAAWENWQHIRDRVMNVPSTSGMIEAVAQAAKAILPAENATSEEVVGSTQQTSAKTETPPEPSAMEDGSLASIVDTMLAELKPKLMEEIAKKLKK